MSVTGSRVYRRVKTAATFVLCLSLCLVFSSILTVRNVSADVTVFFIAGAPSISNGLTQTFEVYAYDSDTVEEHQGGLECKVDADPFAPCTTTFTTPTLTAGDHTFTVHAIGQSNTDATLGFTWNVNQLPTLSGGTSVSGTAGIPIAVTDLQIDDADNDMLLVNLAVPSGTLQLGATAGITFSGSSTGADITFSGTRTDLNNSLTTLTYTPKVAGAVTIEATLRGAADGNRDTFGGHFYQIVTANTVWGSAKTAAEASTFGGVSGYLANVTSADEEAYLQERIGNWMWTGGSDSATEGEWGWTGGPENGTTFWNGGSVGGAYTSWLDTQPDNNGEEDCLEMRRSSPTSWNDEKCGNGRPYIIEYGAPGDLPLLDSTEVSTSAVAAAQSTGEDDEDEEESGIPGYFEVWNPSSPDTDNDNTNEDDDTEPEKVTPVTTEKPDTTDKEQQTAFQPLLFIPLGLLSLVVIIILILRRRK
jgi:hypothetical protein